MNGVGEMRLVVNQITCDGRGLCAELLPELIQLDDWGYPIMTPGPIPQGLERHARRAVADCTVLALKRASADPRR